MPHSYQFKITIKNSHPPIWRRVLVPDGITFRELDDIIEKLFGWTHDHMFEFSFPGDCYFVGTPIASEEDTVDRVIDRYISENDSFSYTYDFGDSWEHTIKVEKILEREERFPVVLKSKGPNMIEDCGGIWGFYDYIDEAEPFDMDRVNQSLSAWIYPVTNHNDLEDKEDFSEMPDVEDYDFQEKNILSDLLGMKADKESFINALEHIKAQENALQKGSMGVKSLKDVFNQYTKDNLKELARLHHFTRFMIPEEFLSESVLHTSFFQLFSAKGDRTPIVLDNLKAHTSDICFSTSWANFPCFSINSSNVPCSTIFPPSSTTIRSQFFTVESLCATIRTVAFV